VVVFQIFRRSGKQEVGGHIIPYQELAIPFIGEIANSKFSPKSRGLNA